eukprot:1433933-Prymnesium_polylepis.1
MCARPRPCAPAAATAPIRVRPARALLAQTHRHRLFPSFQSPLVPLYALVAQISGAKAQGRF